MSEAVDALSGALLAGATEEEIVAMLADSGLEVTSEQLRKAYVNAIFRAKQDETMRLSSAIYEWSAPKTAPKTIDETITRGAFLLRAFRA